MRDKDATLWSMELNCGLKYRTALRFERERTSLLHLHKVHELAAASVAGHAVDAALAAHLQQDIVGNFGFLFR